MPRRQIRPPRDTETDDEELAAAPPNPLLQYAQQAVGLQQEWDCFRC